MHLVGVQPSGGICATSSGFVLEAEFDLGEVLDVDEVVEAYDDLA